MNNLGVEVEVGVNPHEDKRQEKQELVRYAKPLHVSARNTIPHRWQDGIIHGYIFALQSIYKKINRHLPITKVSVVYIGSTSPTPHPKTNNGPATDPCALPRSRSDTSPATHHWSHRLATSASPPHSDRRCARSSSSTSASES